MEGIHVGFDRRICTDASSKPLPIATYCLRTFHRLGTNPTGKTALHLPWSDFRASFGAEDAGIQEYSKDDKPEITGNRPCQAARIPFMYAPVFSPVDPLFRRRVRGSLGVFSRRMSGKRRISSCYSFGRRAAPRYLRLRVSITVLVNYPKACRTLHLLLYIYNFNYVHAYYSRRGGFARH